MPTLPLLAEKEAPAKLSANPSAQGLSLKEDHGLENGGRPSSLQFETRLGLIQHDLDEMKEALNRLEVKQTRMQKTGTTQWEAMTQELKEIREEIFDDNMTNMKDIANITGGLKNRLAEREQKDQELLKEHGN